MTFFIEIFKLWNFSKFSGEQDKRGLKSFEYCIVWDTFINFEFETEDEIIFILGINLYALKNSLKIINFGMFAYKI